MLKSASRLAPILGLLLSFAASAATVPPTLSGIDLISQHETKVTLQNASQLTVVAFLSSRCPCSASHEPVLAALSKEFATDARFVGVHSNADEPQDPSAQHFKTAALPFPVLQDSNAAIANAFGAVKTPHVYVLGKSGEILYQGGVDDSHQAAGASKHYLKDALQALREGRTPPTTLARSLGCTIRR